MIVSRVRAVSDLLRQRGLSVTHQRLAVYRSLLEDGTHPDAERIHRRVRHRAPAISLGTVYKTLETLEDLGAIVKVDSPRSATRYEAVVEPHHHLVCSQCARIFDLQEPAYSRLRPPARSRRGFEITGCTVQFRGRCRECRSRRRKHSPPRRP